MVRAAVGQVPLSCFCYPRECQERTSVVCGVWRGEEGRHLPNSRRRFLRRMQAKYSLPSTVSCQSGTITEPCAGGLAMVEHASEVRIWQNTGNRSGERVNHYPKQAPWFLLISFWFSLEAWLPTRRCISIAPLLHIALWGNSPTLS